MTTTPPLDPQTFLSRFGLTSFRRGQQEVISAVLDGHDCLCIMPTGGGKSLCYQLPAVARDGLTLVISPLIALMKDQVDALAALGMRATFINSSLSPAEQRLRLTNMAAGQYDLVYVAPERLRNSQFLEALRSARLQLLAVDEAHCISEWGHDFRPDYARLGRFRERLRLPQTIALTATATPEVRQDVIELLGLREPKTFVSGFARPNLRFEVSQPGSGLEKDALLLEFLRENPGAGIVYSATRKKCAEVVALIAKELKRTVGLYHAGLLPDERSQVQEDFMANRLQIIVATNAFGMGIDKPDLRFVVHYNMPGCLEAYYQEAGRAGRDGKPSRCLLLYSYQDRFIQEFFIDNAYPSRPIVEQVYDYLRAQSQDPIEFTLDDIKDDLELPIGTEGVGACERLLEKCGALERLDSRENKASVRLDSDLPTLVDLLPKEAKTQRKVLRQVELEVGDLRHERVYFFPEKIAGVAELDRDSVLRALRELNRLECFDYMPAFRGRAIHMHNRMKPFAELEIDFAELERRHDAEYEKLERVVRFAKSRRCLQLEILEYFGDPDRKRCGICENCASPTEWRRVIEQRAGAAAPVAALAAQPLSPTSPADTARPGPLDSAVLNAVRMALSGVARTKGRFGKIIIAQMLRGSKAAEMKKFRLDQLSTYGLLRAFKRDEVLLLLDHLLAAGLLEQIEHERHRPLVQLTDLGTRVMRGQATLDDDLSLPPTLLLKLQANLSPAPVAAAKPPRPLTEDPDVNAANSRLLEALRDDRRESLPEVDAPQPAPVIDAPSAPPPADLTVVPTTPRPTLQPAERVNKASYYWTWQLLESGFTVAECEQIRRLDAAQLLDDVLRAADESLPIKAQWFLSAEQLAELTRRIPDANPHHLRPLLEQLPTGISRQHVQLFLRCRAK